MAVQMVYGTRRADAERLAAKARDEGVKLLRQRGTGRYYATSASRPNVRYAVSLDGGCTCQGYAAFHRCKHMSALLAHFGIVK